MTTVIFIVIAAAAVVLVAWLATRKPSRPYEQRHDQDTAWNDPLTPAAPDAKLDRPTMRAGDPSI